MIVYECISITRILNKYEIDIVKIPFDQRQQLTKNYSILLAMVLSLSNQILS